MVSLSPPPVDPPFPTLSRRPRARLLPMQLSLAALNWQSCCGVLNGLKHGWLSPKMLCEPMYQPFMQWMSSLSALPLPLSLDPKHTAQWQYWLEMLHNDPRLWDAAMQAATQRFQEVLQGAQRYRSAPLPSYDSPLEVVWQEEHVRVLHHPLPADVSAVATVLLVPSLINRYYIMDLSAQRSVMAAFAARGIHAYIIDWGQCEPEHHDHGVAHHIRAPLCSITQWLRAQHPQHKLILGGHCMGGLLAAGAAQILPPEQVQGVFMVATPWDFSARAMQVPPWNEGLRSSIRTLIESQPCFDGDLMLALFYLRDLMSLQEKLRHFAHESDPAKIEHFVAVEDWANDCVNVTQAVARDCLWHWGVQNQLAQGTWEIMRGVPLDPAQLTCPTMLIIPRKDRIVLPSSTAPLAERMQACHILRPDTGHVGMLVGAHAAQHFIDPLLAWIMRHT